jgi:hypothetical protein
MVFGGNVSEKPRVRVHAPTRPYRATAEIHFLSLDEVSPRTLLHQVAAWDDVEQVVMVVRVDGRWRTFWSDSNLGNMSMAALKLMNDLQDLMHGVELSWSPPEDDGGGKAA